MAAYPPPCPCHTTQARKGGAAAPFWADLRTESVVIVRARAGAGSGQSRAEQLVYEMERTPGKSVNISLAPFRGVTSLEGIMPGRGKGRGILCMLAKMRATRGYV